MGKIVLIKRTIAGVFYISGLSFAAFVIFIIAKGNAEFDADGLIVSALGVCIPVAIATFLLITATNETEKRYKIMRVFIFIVFGFYSILMTNMLFLNGYRQFIVSRTTNITEFLKWNTNFIPFKTIGEYIQSYYNGSKNESIIIQNLFGNILLFMPIGILLPCLFQSLHNFRKFLMVLIIALVGIEVGQLLTRTGSCDIDDVILNFVGAVLFYVLWSLKVMQKMLRKIYAFK